MASQLVLFVLLVLMLGLWGRRRLSGRAGGVVRVEGWMAALALAGGLFGLAVARFAEPGDRAWSWAFLGVGVLDAVWLAQCGLPLDRWDRWTFYPAVAALVVAFPLLGVGGRAATAGAVLIGVVFALALTWVAGSLRAGWRAHQAMDATMALMQPLDVQLEYPDTGVEQVDDDRVVAGPWRDMSPFDLSGQTWYVLGPPGEPTRGARPAAARLAAHAQLRLWAVPTADGEVWSVPDPDQFAQWAAELSARGRELRAAGYEAMGMADKAAAERQPPPAS